MVCYIFRVMLLYLPIIKAVIHNKNNLDITVCQDYSVLIYSGNNNYYKLVDVIRKATVTLLCKFCADNDVHYRTKTWFFKQRGTNNNNIRHMDPSSKSLQMPSNNLQIINFNKNHSGIYICKYSDTYNEGKFTYVLDEIFDDNVITETGPINKWQRYQRKILNPVNNKIKNSMEEPFNTFRRNYRFSFNIITFWENWGSCEPTSWRRGAVRKKLAKCRLHPVPRQNAIDPFKALTRYYLADGFDVSCRSVILNESCPELSKITRNIPEYEAIETCDPNDSGNAEGKDRSKNKIVKQIAEKGHITLVCPELITDSNIDWFKNNEYLNSSYRNNMAKSEEEPHLTIDSYNSLFILNATKDEEGTYKCKAKGEIMQIYEIKVISKSSLINREFIRYSIYLGFVLSISVTFYCTGICVAWHKRASFLDHTDIYQMRTR